MLLLRKRFVNDRVVGDDCLLDFALWHGSSHALICMRDATVSLKVQGLLLIAACMRVV